MSRTAELHADTARERALRHALDNLTQAAADLLNTTTISRGRYAEDSTFYMHEGWAADVLRAEVATARITLAQGGV